MHQVDEASVRSPVDKSLPVYNGLDDFLSAEWPQNHLFSSYGHKDQTQGSYVLVLRPKAEGIPETSVCRILLFM